MELNAEQIKKDLECCKFGKDEAKCKECNWHPWIKPRCWRLLASNALALITSQEQKIKELTEENERLKAEDSKLLNEFMNWLQANEHINKSVEYRKELCDMFINDKRLNK